MSPEQAQTIALQALGWLVANDDLCPIFLGSTGGAWVVAFCDAQGLKYDMPLRARYALPGAENVNWT